MSNEIEQLRETLEAGEVQGLTLARLWPALLAVAEDVEGLATSQASDDIEKTRLRVVLWQSQGRLRAAIRAHLVGTGEGEAVVTQSVTTAPEPTEAIRTVVITDYHSSGRRPYHSVPHDPETDERLSLYQIVEGLRERAGVTDGEEVELIMRRTGRRTQLEKMRLVAPHTYRRAPQSEEYHR